MKLYVGTRFALCINFFEIMYGTYHILAWERQ